MMMERSAISVPMVGLELEKEGLGEEEVLVVRARSGDEIAFGELVEIYQKKIFNFVYSRLQNRETAEDVTQEVLVKAFFNLNRLREIKKFKSWLFSIANNHVRDLRRKAKLKMVDNDEELSSRETYVSAVMPDDVVLEESRAHMIRRAMMLLSPEQKEVLMLCDIEGMSYSEIAEITRVPLGTVQSRIFYARKRLKDILVKEFNYRGDW